MPLGVCLALATLLAACDGGTRVSAPTGDPADDASSGMAGGVTGDAANRPIDATGITSACPRTASGLALCATSDMARITRRGVIPLEHLRYDIAAAPLALRAARDETIAFQLVARRITDAAPRTLRVTSTPWTTADGRAVRAAPARQSLFAAHYVAIVNGAYTSGPPTRVLATPDDYPDALVPQARPCRAEGDPLFDAITLPAASGVNQALWIDLHVAADTAPGTYTRRLLVESDDGERLEVPLTLEVIGATLPATPSIDALGELYRTYALEGVGRDPSTPAWRDMSRCYQQEAHRHRLVFIERRAGLPDAAALEDHARTIEPALSGELFTEAYGYEGAGVGAPLALWRTPWPQSIDSVIDASLSAREIDRYRTLAADWARLVAERGWNDTRWFAYVFDEVDGQRQIDAGSGTDPDDTSAAAEAARRRYVTRVHEDIRRVQRAIDAGSPNVPIDLLWTSHSNPRIWRGEAGLDLVGTTRLWAPNAHAADPAFLAEREAAGERTWFYHSGHPAIGGHAINLPGTDMRTWGVAGARYGISGQLMWSVNLGSDLDPYGSPTWNPADDRVGNGVMVYPGNRLPDIGYAAAPGPVPSMRLKSWRRGLQDAELYLLARERDPAAAERLIRTIMPRAFVDALDGDGTPAWPDDPAAWIAFRDGLLGLLSD